MNTPGMFEIAPEPEFSAWFESLSEPEAEQVTEALEVIASAGSVLRPARVSRLLLWYDGTVGAPAVNAFGVMAVKRLAMAPLRDDAAWASAMVEDLLSGDGSRAGDALAAATESIHDLLAWHADMTRVLESTAFVARLERLPPDVAVAALDEVERLKHRLRALRFETLLRHGASASVHEWRTVRADLEAPLLRVLQLVGIEARTVAHSEHGLRELTLATSPKLRILFGTDPVRRRIVAIVGEALTRSYYGDSVRLAEQRWAAYCGEPRAAEAP